MDITLYDIDKGLCGQWERDFNSYSNIKVEHCDFKNLTSHKCIVSPVNSFGLMDGGFDFILSNYFDGIQEKVQDKIKSMYGGIQPVGSSVLIETSDSKFPFLAHTPTMMFPSDIRGTLNVFLAFRAVLKQCEDNNISSLACNGLGYGTGAMPADVISKQMKLAYYTKEYEFKHWYSGFELLKDLLLIEN